MTTRDIAAELALSVSTVGRALSGDSRISEPTRIRVEAKALELGYVGNTAARLMRGAPSNVVAFMIPDVRNTFYTAAAHALTQSLGSLGVQVMLSETNDDPATELAQIRGMAAARVAGVILTPSPTPKRESIRLLADIPHVQLLRHDRVLGSHWFGVDDAGVLRDATDHLIRLGHERIAYVGGHAGLSTADARLRGFRDAVRGDGCDDLIVRIRPSEVTDARGALRALLDLPSPPTALVTASIRATEGVLEELNDLGIRVPSDLSVVGFGDEPGFSWWGPGLTTMALPVHEIATQCSTWFHQRLTDGWSDTPYRSSSHGYLLERGSTAAA
ncbi:LacI family DNA-binding transcriptional regulator [Rhodococcus opacus]|uniref:LacI family DNA-binding transcriptional regulator n=1 Tax=Rhodococcus opacus TaxID=37919 RepID=UPI00211DF76B|nr:LacI family DNA-binding transcriptional regulator [Rhodococcus opacus]